MDLQEGAVDRERGPQLVRGVRDEPLLGGEGPLQPVQHLVEGVGELLELVVGAVELDPPGQIGTGHLAGGPGDPAERGEHPSRHGVTEGEGDDAQAEQGEERTAQEVVQGPVALVPQAERDGVVELVAGGVHGQLADGAGGLDRAVDDLEGQL